MINTQLLRKELALQRTNLMFLAGVVLFWAVLVAASFFQDVPIGYEHFTVGDVVRIVNYIGVVVALTVLFPLMVGASAVSSERRLETLDWQMSLPKGRMRQWATKSFVVLVLTCVSGGILAPLLNWLLAYRLAPGGVAVSDIEGFPPWLFGRLWPGFFAMFFASAGLYVSALTRDTYKALMGAIALVVFTFYGMRYVIDPTGLLWPFKSFANRPPYSEPTAHYLALVSFTLLVLYLGLHNFRFERVSRRRFAWQMVIWIIAANVTGWYLLRWEFNTPYVTENGNGPVPISRLVGAEDPEVPNSGPSTPIRLPGTNRVALHSPGHVLDVNVVTGALRQLPNVSGTLEKADPAGKGYTVDSWVITDLPIPLNMETWIGRLLLPMLPATAHLGTWKPIQVPVLAAEYVDENGQSRSLAASNERICWQSRTLFVAEDKNTMYGKTCLFLRKAGTGPDSCEQIDCGQRYREDWCISPDEKWYTRFSSSTTGPLTIIRVDKSTSYTLEPRGGAVCVAPGQLRGHWDAEQIDEMGQRYFMLPVSKDGRHLAFIRTIPLRVEVEGRRHCSGFPEFIEIALLDLGSGEETTIARVRPSQVAIESQAGLVRSALGDKSAPLPIPLTGQWQSMGFPFYHQMGFPMAWSDDGKLAALDDGLLYVCEPKRGGSGFNSIQLRVPVGVTNLEFFNDEALLVWGKGGLWRVDLPQGKVASIVAGPPMDYRVKVLNQ